MGFTLLLAYLASYYSSVGLLFTNFLVQILSLVAGIAALVYLVCSRDARHRVPLNYALLGVITWMETCGICELTA